ncbi:dipeptidyl-peptidase-4 [Kribbella steppae]|uniref:Dipeptidyl-peptidase-4 n=1 Tax=Kribbella steppae TaxID=2512223 RepID=A0A4R2HD57_9ACTN|nr:prolyl oligopeptidase family serine peptidase [Kribbella steppae]TCO26220.1 dipeptidyl-peptidase-4 [Kribbella steppae]
MVADLPGQLVRTKRFRAGAPSHLKVVGAGRFVVFLRDDALWAYDVQSKRERRVGPATSYHASESVLVVLRERDVFVADLVGELSDQLPIKEVAAAQVDPTGKTVAFVRDRALRVIGVDGSGEQVLAEDNDENVFWGLAEFSAWMSMGRGEGLWWSPDGQRILAARVDESQVQLRYLSDPADPTSEPRAFRYPAAGTANADVRLFVLDLDGEQREVQWDRQRFEYVVRAGWTVERPLIVVQTRDQQCLQVLEVDPGTGRTTLVREVTDPQFVGVPERTPAQTASGRLVWIDRDQACDTYRLVIGDEVVTPPGLQVDQVCCVSGEVVTFLAQTDPTEVHLYVWDGAVRRLTEEPGVHSGLVADGTIVIDSRTLTGRRITVNGQALDSFEEEPVLDLRVEFVSSGPKELRTAVFRPSWHAPGSSKLPVLLTPYAGPGAQMALKHRAPQHLVSRWFAEHGFTVLSTDGRGTPGRGPAFDRATVGDILEPVLEDQIEALHLIAERYGDLDLDRVAIRGWSYGGYLSIAALLHRPDVFHAAIGGAALTDQRGYDTYWKERYLGHPDTDTEAYRRTSLLPYAANLDRPLLMIQGLADTNVWATHAIRFSGALNALGKPHELVLLPGEGHGLTNPRTIENLLHRELAFLHQHLRMT